MTKQSQAATRSDSTVRKFRDAFEALFGEPEASKLRARSEARIVRRLAERASYKKPSKRGR